MSEVRATDPKTGERAETRMTSVVAALRVDKGTTAEDTAPVAEVLTRPGRVRRSRHGEEFFFLFNPAGGVASPVCHEVREIVRETYWSTSGSVTAALRRSVSMANQHLFEHNLNADRSERCYGGLTCAVLRDRDLFLLQAGPIWACVLQEEKLRCFPRGEKLAHMGIGRTADVRLHHVFASPGDTLLLAPPAVLRDAGKAGLRRMLSLEDVDDIAKEVEVIGGESFAALVVRWEEAAQRQTEPVAAPRPPEAPDARSGSRTPRVAEKEAPAVLKKASEEPVQVKPRRPPKERKPLFMDARRSVGKGLKRGLGYVGDGLSVIWHALAAAGAGVLALGGWLLGLIWTMVRSTLPGSERAVDHRTHHRPPPEENRTVMTVLAAAIPIIVLVVMVIAYRQFATKSRLEGILNQAREQITLAQAAAPDSEEARSHWEQALDEIERALALQPDHGPTQALQDQAQQALDDFHSIERLTLTQLFDFRSTSRERRLVLGDQMVFVLDRDEGWVAGVPLNRSTNQAPNGDDAEEGELVLVHTGERVGGEDVGRLVDCTWLGAEGGRQSKALLILEEQRRVLSYDPVWRSESGAAQLSRVTLSSPPPGRPVAVGSYKGQFYILDSTAGSGGQIWRYRPEGNAYPVGPEQYFTSGPSQSLSTAVDMAIDGYIYVLYEDGEVTKFLGGEAQPFEIRGIPNGLGEIAAFAVDPQGDGRVYVADPDHSRIVALDPEGRFEAQFRADGDLAGLEAVAVDQAEGRLYVLDQGRLYTAPLP